jgi:hypothetical protein
MKVNTAGVKTFSDGSKSPENGRYYVTLEKSIHTQEQKIHRHYARMTFDKKGKLVKLTTSR